MVEEVLGDEGKLPDVRSAHVETDETREIRGRRLFVAIGHDPNTELFLDQLDMDDAGYLVKPGSTATNVEGVFAAGDVVDHTYRQAVTAAGRARWPRSTRSAGSPTATATPRRR